MRHQIGKAITMATATQTTPPNLRHLELLAKLLDGQFRIPGTNIRFGFDAILGLIPGVGDIVSLAISAFMVSSLAKNGASGMLLTRMVLNISVDALIGAIPIVGDIFDVGFRANQRNMKLMREHYSDGKHRGSGLWLRVLIALFLVAMFAGMVWLMIQFFKWLF